MHVLTLGTRGSALAKAQTELARNALRAEAPNVDFRVVAMQTTGDIRHDVPLTQMGRFGVFVSEIENALLAGIIDVAVHSAKDMPSNTAEGTRIAAYLRRANASDVLVSHATSLAALPARSRVGTSSPRRVCLLRAARPDLDIIEMRGNVDTRLERLHAGHLDALVLAAAGLTRLGRASEIAQWFDPYTFVPSPGQGAIALQVRANDTFTHEVVRRVNDSDTAVALLAERAFLARSGAGCEGAIGAYAQLTAPDSLVLVGMLGDVAGRFVRQAVTGPRAAAPAMGRALVDQLITRARGDGIYFSRGAPATCIDA